MQVFQCFRWFFDCLQRPIRTAFETLPFIRYVCLLTGSQRELEHDGKRKTGSWKWESICRITFIDFKRNGAECIRLGDRQLTYAMQYSHLRVSFLNGIVYWSIDDDDDALLFQEPFFFFWKMLGSLETEKVWNARGSVWKLTKNLIYYWSGGCSAAPFIITFIGRIEHHPSQELPHSWLQWRQWFPPAHHSWSLFKQKVLFSLFFSSFSPISFLYNGEFVCGAKQTNQKYVDRLLNVAQESWFQNDTIDPQYPHRRSSVLDDITAATFLDVAVVRCLFIPRWCEEGVHWALQFLFYRYNKLLCHTWLGENTYI